MGPSDRNVLEVQGLTVRFDTSERSVVAVKDLGFHVRAGEVLAIVGESGSGKSVTSLSVMRLIEHGGGTIASGKISFTRRNGGKLDLAKAADSVMRTIRGGEISMIFQEPMTSLNPVFSVGTQVAEAVMLHQGLSHAEAEAEALRMLELVRIPEAKQILKRYPHQLSGGMRQRVMIAMALSCKPSLLIADEPTTALDVTIQAQILQLIRQLQEEMGMAVIFITHDMGVVAEVADRVLVMYHGEAVEEGTCEQIFHNPRHPYTQSLLAAVPRLGSMRGTDEPAPFPLLRITDPEAEQLGTADMDETPVDMPEPVASVPSVSDGPVLSVDNLITRFDVETGFWGKVKRRVHAVEQVSFNLYPGETLGLVGESGCGKSTLGRTLIRLIPATDGHVYLDGEDISGLKGKALKQMRKKAQIIFQDPSACLNPRRTVRQILMEPFQIHHMTGSMDVDARIEELLHLVGLDTYHLSRYPHELSGGQKQRIGIARALALEPKLIICDEAVSALDVSVQAQVLNLLQELKERLGLTYFFISHNLNVVYQVSDRVGVMYLGKMVEIAAYDQLYEKRYHPYTEALLSAIPQVDADDRTERIHLTGEVPSPSDPPSGCPFHTRCPKACDICSKEIPQLKEIEKGHFVACHLYQ